jgi:hypothetical protein
VLVHNVGVLVSLLRRHGVCLLSFSLLPASCNHTPANTTQFLHTSNTTYLQTCRAPALPQHHHPSARSRRCPLLLLRLVPGPPCPTGSRCRLPLSRRRFGCLSSMPRSSPLPFAVCLRAAGTGKSLVAARISLGGGAGGFWLSTWERPAGRVRAAVVSPGLSKSNSIDAVFLVLLKHCTTSFNVSGSRNSFRVSKDTIVLTFPSPPDSSTPGVGEGTSPRLQEQLTPVPSSSSSSINIICPLPRPAALVEESRDERKELRESRTSCSSWLYVVKKWFQ